MPTYSKDPLSDRSLFNIDILVLDNDKAKQLKEVKKMNIFESNSKIFEPEGLFSETIFGPVGSSLRNERPGYISLGIPVYHPLIWKHILGFRSIYLSIAEGKKKARFDNNLKEFVEDSNGQTGMHFLMSNFHKVKPTKANSDQRAHREELVHKFSQPDMWLDKYLVLPAGLRDYVVDDKGQPSEDEINALYRKLFMTCSMAKGVKVDEDNIHLLDPLRLRIQRIVLEIYEYISTLLDGKNKFIQGKWAKRGISYGTRNVITPSAAKVSDLTVNNELTANHTVCGLYQFTKGIFPIAANKITMFMSRFLNTESDSAVLVDKNTLTTGIFNIPVKKRDKWLSMEGISSILNYLTNEAIRTEPVEIDNYYLMMIYDDGKNIKLFYDTSEIDSSLDKKYIRPITYTELIYISIYSVKDKYPAFLTRYPVGGLGGIYPTKIYLKTTYESRTVELEDHGRKTTVTEYPKLNSTFVESMSPHYTHIAKLGADFDGDMTSLNILYSEESIKEIDEILTSPNYYVSPGLDMNFSVANDVLELTLAHMCDRGE